ncbi:DUF998 domain-containing protein [Nocardiopsis alba]|uniref:DUF998 domain-containing protein n=1 Tax=Nocardiopsis alba TaxID=53437 RepID=UPI003D747BD5
MATATTPVTARTHRRRAALLAGAAAGPLFFASAGAQMLAREGFDITRHPISQLATGGTGWIQILTFVLAGAGILALAAALGATVTEGTGRRALPVLVGVFGVGLIAAGVFTMDPEYGFPPGTPEGPVERMSWHGVAHSVAAAIAYTALAVAAIVWAVRRARRRLMVSAVASAVVALVLLMPMHPEYMSVRIAVNGLVAFAWTSVLSLSLWRSS